MNDEVKTSGKGRSLGKGCLIVVGVIVLLGVIGAIFGDDEDSSTHGDPSSADDAAQAAPAADAVAVTATELSAAYQENEAKAQLAFGKKHLLVTGTVKDITLDFADNPVIELKGAGDQYGMGVNSDGKMTDVSINGISQEQAAQIEKGAEMTFACPEVSEVMGSPQLSDCRIAQ